MDPLIIYEIAGQGIARNPVDDDMIPPEMKRNSREILDDLRLRPALYTGEATLSSIRHFLSGYSLATDRYGVGHPDDLLLIPRDFHDWVAYRLHFYESTSGWCRMICSKTASDEAAIERFFTLLGEYYDRSAHLVARLAGLKNSYSRTTPPGQLAGPTETVAYTDSIALVTYTDDPGFFAYSETEADFPCEGFFPTMESFESRTGATRDMLTICDQTWKPDKCA